MEIFRLPPTRAGTIRSEHVTARRAVWSARAVSLSFNRVFVCLLRLTVLPPDHQDRQRPDAIRVVCCRIATSPPAVFPECATGGRQGHADHRTISRVRRQLWGKGGGRAAGAIAPAAEKRWQPS